MSTMRFFYPYPEDTVFTDEACITMVHQVVDVRVGNLPTLKGTILAADNDPDKKGIYIELRIEKGRLSKD